MCLTSYYRNNSACHACGLVCPDLSAGYAVLRSSCQLQTSQVCGTQDIIEVWCDWGIFAFMATLAQLSCKISPANFSAFCALVEYFLRRVSQNPLSITRIMPCGCSDFKRAARRRSLNFSDTHDFIGTSMLIFCVTAEMLYLK